jgi:hypothetical protein
MPKSHVDYDARERVLQERHLGILLAYAQDLQMGVDTLSAVAKDRLRRLISAEITACEIKLYTRSGSRKGGVVLFHKALRQRVGVKALGQVLLMLANPGIYSVVRYRRFLKRHVG